MSRSCAFVFLIVAGIGLTGCGVTLNDVSPDAASVGSEVTLTGTGFGASQGASQVFVDGVDAGAATSWSETSIRVAVPVGAGTGPITVRVGSVTSNPVPFIVSAPAALWLPLARDLPAPGAGALLGNDASAQRDLDSDTGTLSSSRGFVAVGDLDEDTNPDIVRVYGQNYCRWLGDGAGRFDQPTCLTFGIPGQDGGGLDLGDVNEDGHLDMVASLGDTVALLTGDGTGTLGPALDLAQYPSPYSVKLVALNRDQHLDLVVRNASELRLLQGDGGGGFVAEGVLSVGTQPHEIGAGDLNADGWPDLVTSNYSSGDLSVVLSDGGGGFLPEQRIDVDTSPTGLVVEDLSGDGKVDVAVTHDGFSSTNAVRVFLGNGQGQLAAGQVIPEAGMMQSLASADMNGDGVLDLLAGSNAGVHTLLGYGDGTFVHWASSYATYARGIAVGDFNRDGRADIAQAGLIGSPVMLGDGSGRFAEPIRVKLEAVGLNGVRAADLDADGNADLVVLDDISSELQALMGDGVGGFTVTAAPLLGPPQPGGEYGLGDFDGDGDLDAIVYRKVGGSHYLDTYRGNGLGGFTTWGSVPIPRTPMALTIGDMNQDERDDLLLGFWPDEGASVTVWHSTGTGTFSQSLPAVATIVPNHPSGLAVGRLNGDARLDIVLAGFPYPGGDSDIHVLLANAAGGYDLATQIPSSGGELRLVDMDRDGKLDILRKDFDSGNGCPGPYEVYRSDGTGQFTGPIVSPCRGPLSAVVDVNGDTFPDVVSSRLTVDVSLGTGTGALVATPDSFWEQGYDFHPYSSGAADVNGDGQMDFARVDGSGQVRIFLGDGAGGFSDLLP